jgi:hypothetical protein
VKLNAAHVKLPTNAAIATSRASITMALFFDFH